jgi:tRNA (guanine37-N1)-methyltransferase
MLHVTVVTLFGELFETFAKTSLVGRAVDNQLLDLQTYDLRQHGLGRHLAVDDTPYGGGSGMVLRVDCIVAAMEAVEQRHGSPLHRVLLTPQGAPFTQRTAERWAQGGSMMFICGRYEGFDERVRSFVDEEASLGDFVMTGGEVAAMAMIEATIRLRPGVLGNETSATEESFSSAQSGGLEYPHYTRPADFRGLPVPELLKQGDHAKIAGWRGAEAKTRTAQRRPDLAASEPGRGGKP